MMIEGSKQQQLTFDKGITNVPSDNLCSDNTLAESVGLVYDDGEHKVIQKPKLLIKLATDKDGNSMSIPTILFLHKYDTDERYIYVVTERSGGTDYYNIWWAKKVNAVLETRGSSYLYRTNYKDIKITSIGKTLIISDDKGLHYYLWTKDLNNVESYESLGDSFPRPKVEFSFTSSLITTASARCDDMIENYTIKAGKQSEWNDTIVGLYYQIRNKIWRKKQHLGSFCVRVALELYDGSYYHISNPILLLNQFSAIAVAYIIDDEQVQMQIPSQYLQYKSLVDFSKWSDIIKDVVVFATEEASLFDTISDAICEKASRSMYLDKPFCYRMESNTIVPDSHTFASGARVLESVPDADIEDTIKEGVYYKLCSLGITNTVSFNALPIKTHTLENLTTQERLDYDDYYSLCPFRAKVLYDYNSRLNLADVSRGFFEGYDYFMPFDQGTQYPYTFYVTIKTDSGDIVVSHSADLYQKQGIYFYYPDARAKKVVITKNGNIILSRNLKEHPSLNGAYYLGEISPDMVEPSADLGTIPTVTPGPPFERLPNYVITSEVSNPFVFRAEGYNKVGTGKIIGLSSITTALSQGQFGQYPLMVFSDDGLWAMSMNSEGLFTAVHPMSREVCNNANSITQTDGAVFFTSEKGLMVVVGSDVKCVSEQLSGKTDKYVSGLSSDVGDFPTLLKECVIAFDYRDSLLWLFRKRENYSYEYCYIYNIRNGTFAKYHFESNSANVINSYPDYLLQGEDNKVYSLLDRPNINVDGEMRNAVFVPYTYSANMITRPMKLENALALKTIMQLRNITLFDPYEITDWSTTPARVTSQKGTITLRLFASNNLEHWVELHSLTGMPWKYYRFRYDFADLIATDRFAGTMLITQERRTDKLR